MFFCSAWPEHHHQHGPSHWQKVTGLHGMDSTQSNNLLHLMAVQQPHSLWGSTALQRLRLPLQLFSPSGHPCPSRIKKHFEWPMSCQCGSSIVSNRNLLTEQRPGESSTAASLCKDEFTISFLQSFKICA